jgi:glucose-1-phosphate adenylyltransferase
MNGNALGIIFSNMHDEELHEITASRTMGSVPFGGRYRLIDFALSNMRNSGLNSIGVIAKNNYQSLLDHIDSGKEWDLSRKRGGLYLFPPYGMSHSGYYKNKIEALFGILEYIKQASYEHVVLTDCDILCNMNWRLPLEYHKDKKADITIVYYKPKQEDKTSEATQTHYTISPEGYVSDILIEQRMSKNGCIGTNMWVIGRDLLVSLLEDAVAHNYENMERDILQKKLNTYKIAAWEFDGYIRKINSMSAYFQANIDILNTTFRNDLFFKYGQIYTKVLDDTPARYAATSKVSNSIIAEGCIIEGSVENSILFNGVYVGRGTVVSNSVIMQNGMIGENVTLNYVLADKQVVINNNRTLIGYDQKPIYIKKKSNV